MVQLKISVVLFLWIFHQGTNIIERFPVTVCLDKSSCLDLIKNMQIKYYYLNFHSTCTSFHNASEACLIPSEIVSVCIFILYITL